MANAEYDLNAEYTCFLDKHRAVDGGIVFNYTAGESCDLQDVPEKCLCNYTAQVVDCMSTSRIPYLDGPYCVFQDVMFVGDLLMLLWLAYLFVNLALVVDARVVPNVTTIAKMLNMSDSLAGLTLLAFGNGVVDIFSAGAAVMASEDGGTMGFSVLLGCGLYVVTVVSGVVAFNFEPEVKFAETGRDALFYMVGLVWACFVLEDHKLELWEIIGFPVLYVLYLTYAIMEEQLRTGPPPVQGTWRYRLARCFRIVDESSEKLPLVSLVAEKQPNGGGDHSNESWNVDYYDGVHPGIIKALSRYQHLKTHTESLEHANTVPGSWACTLSRMDIWDSHEGAPWSRKSTAAKILVVLQIPMRIVLSLSTPVVFHEDLTLAWDKRLHVMMSFLALPIIVVLVEEDAFYWKFTEDALVPSLLVASVIGACGAIVIARTSEVDTPPRYNNMFAVLGFLVALVFIYAISEEVVSIIRSFGLMWGIPTSIVAMAVLGAGNGTCDLVSNYIIASQGRPNIAIGAVYGAPVLNLYMGVTTMGIIGAWKYGLPYKIKVDQQIFMGLAVILVALIPAIVASRRGTLGPNTAKFLFGLYFMFLTVSLMSLFFI